MSQLDAPNYTNIPNVVFDYWMPKLRSSTCIVLVTLCSKILRLQKTSQSISTNQLCRCSGLSKPTVLNAVKELEEIGVVLVERSTEGQKNRRNTYRLDLNNAQNGG